MKMKVWRAVRCCCQPKKILGFMKVDEHQEMLILRDESGLVRFPIDVMSTCLKTTVSYDFEKLPEPEEISRELAIKSEDHPIEFWRKQKGFIENKE